MDGPLLIWFFGKVDFFYKIVQSRTRALNITHRQGGGQGRMILALFLLGRLQPKVEIDKTLGACRRVPPSARE